MMYTYYGVNYASLYFFGLSLFLLIAIVTFMVIMYMINAGRERPVCSCKHCFRDDCYHVR